jgi:hypothetical protein
VAAAEPIARLQLLTRSDCGLCEEMRAELQELAAVVTLPSIAILDVDAHPDLQRRYGLKVPVLLLDGVPVCHGHLDVAELRRLLRHRL